MAVPSAAIFHSQTKAIEALCRLQFPTQIECRRAELVSIRNFAYGLLSRASRVVQ